MSITVEYQVHNPHNAPNAHKAVIKGHEVTASVDTLEVELKATDLSHGGIKLRFIGGDVDAARALFVNDAFVTATFDAVPASDPTSV